MAQKEEGSRHASFDDLHVTQDLPPPHCVCIKTTHADQLLCNSWSYLIIADQADG